MTSGTSRYSTVTTNSLHLNPWLSVSYWTRHSLFTWGLLLTETAHKITYIWETVSLPFNISFLTKPHPWIYSFWWKHALGYYVFGPKHTRFPWGFLRRQKSSLIRCNRCNLQHVWERQSVKNSLPIIKAVTTSSKTQNEQLCFDKIKSSHGRSNTSGNKLRTYASLKSRYIIENYLNVPFPTCLHTILQKFGGVTWIETRALD